ncbi:MAG: aromatic amino acid lyase, partial [Bacteroidetes bacterium]
MSIRIGGNFLSLREVQQIVFAEAPVQADKKAQQRVLESYQFLQDFAADKVIYGINTGFGPMAQYKIREADQVQLQYNLIRSHASGCGEVLPVIVTRAAMLA